MKGAGNAPFVVENPSETNVGILDAIKRWRLARQGLSSGKKRRVHTENAAIQSLELSRWVRFSLYAIFIVGAAMLILRASFHQAAFATNPWMGVIAGSVVALTAVSLFHVAHDTSCRRNSRVILVLGGILGHLGVVWLTMGLSRHGVIPEALRFLMIPFALAPMLLGVLLGRPIGSFAAIFSSLLGSLLVASDERLTYLILSLVSGVTAVLATNQVRKRVELLRAGVLSGVVGLVVALLLGRVDLTELFGSEAMARWQTFALVGAAPMGTGIVTALVISGLLPVFEGMFRVTTGISWLELSDLNHKLLRRMQLEAPGTFHHSLVVASLAEAAAESIGANAQLCRVCAYFHDVGKLKKPEYFIENQHDGAENPHDLLTPTMSALVIIAHVKDGVDLAVKHKLNPRIIDVIQEHHGDSLVYYFYRKAQEQKKCELEKCDKGLGNREDLPHVEEKNFRYPGPKPRTVESGIIALADSIESASRTIRKPSPAKIRALIEDIVQSRIADGQLDECALTMRELAKVKDSFANTLRCMLHSRIDYPKEEEGKPASSKRSAEGHKPGLSSERDLTRGGRTVKPGEAA